MGSPRGATRPAASLAGAWRSTLDDMLSLALVNLLVVADVPPADAAVHRGTGWYSAGTTVPEPPIALALVIVAAAGMRVRERRRNAAAAATSSTDRP
ncbi:hypothetical protein OV203_18200 [Nannocystis sp. ILAH1]|uniref:hypothetical protein n=1 Tax=unclassified Nannocystis TaxID=2627009 RepID=UPI00226EEFA8|nr:MULTISPECIES: hypothetical protein [unclassified Nannocystis]MCY0989074.1 hypothetical protein [Nannocystis sp. ILAH1]MCY1067991.1 hypothetical protein [Nannocystis sp. RBIL2]